MKEKHEMINLTANVVGEVKKGSFEQKGEQIFVTNFSLVHTEGEKKRYTSCSAYGRFSEQADNINLHEGDLIHVYGYIRKSVKGNKHYRNFIVKHIDLIDAHIENKEEK